MKNMIKIYCKWKNESTIEATGKYLHLWFETDITMPCDIQGIVVNGRITENSQGDIHKTKKP